MKYIINLDALKDCMDLLSQRKEYGICYVHLTDVKALIDRFPKEVYNENTKEKEI